MDPVTHNMLMRFEVGELRCSTPSAQCKYSRIHRNVCLKWTNKLGPRKVHIVNNNAGSIDTSKLLCGNIEFFFARNMMGR
jgi:hypothetical protein